MKEGYAGLIGASAPTFAGTPKSMKAYPVSPEPLWACGDCSASSEALRSSVYGKVLTQGSDNNFYVGTDRTGHAAAARAFRKHLQDAPEPLDEAGDGCWPT